MKVKQISNIPAASSPPHVIKIDPQTDLRWEAFMSNLSTDWIYYSPAWLQVLEEVYGYKPMHLACEDASGQVVGILPLFYSRGWRSGRVLRSVFAGPLASDVHASAMLVQAAVECARAEPGTQLHLKITSNALDAQVENLVGVPSYQTYHLALPERAELFQLDVTIKRAIKKATRMGVEVREAQTERELRAWYEMYLHTMHKLVVLPNPYRFFQLAWQHLHAKGMLRLLLAEQVETGQRRLLAGNLLLQHGQTISFDSSGWREEDQSLRPNDLLHWRAIQHACARGLRWYDFGDVSFRNSGLARYKSKWGAEAKTAYDYSYPAHHHEMNGAKGHSRNATRQLMLATWQRLPARAVGLLSDWYYALHLY